MAASTVVRARIDLRIKNEAADILAATGLTLSGAFRMMLVRTVAEKRLPFDPSSPTPRPSRPYRPPARATPERSARRATCMRTIERTTLFKRDYKREAKGRHRKTLDQDLLTAVTPLAQNGTLP
jgi:addiction module RelB/DinJ family antitoxin